MHIRKRGFSLILSLFLLFTISVTAYAHEVPDVSRAGSIRITMHYDGAAVSGGTLTLYQAGDIHEDDGNYSFVLSKDFAESCISLNDIQSTDTAEDLSKYAVSEKLQGTIGAIEDDGTVSFAVDPGLYLLMQEDAAEGYDKVSPFLVSVPMSQDGAYVYDVDASPKVEIIKAPVTPPADNPEDPKLPQTGQLNWPIPMLVILGLLFFSIGWFLRFGGKEKHDAK